MNNEIASNMLQFVENGTTEYHVVLSTSASPSQQFAAAEFCKYFHQCTQNEIPLLIQDTDIPKKSLILGDHPLISTLLPDFDLNSLEEEGFAFKTIEEYIIIIGSKTRGTIYGVYSFLEEFFKIKFYSNDYIVVHPLENLTISSLDNNEMPGFKYRIVTYLNLMDPDYAVTQKINLDPFLEEKHGGNFFISTAHMTHTFYQLVDPKIYYNTHPEYFALSNGVRIGNVGQLCLSNSSVVDIAVDSVLSWFKEDPRIQSVGVVQNDCAGFCECDNCRAIEEETGSHSGLLIDFCNKIANKVKEIYPDRFVHTIAYTYSLDPPINVEPAENLIVVLCDMYPTCADQKTIGDDPLTVPFLNALKGWLNITKHVMVWHYCVDFVHFLLPFPNFKSLYSDSQLYKKLGVEGLFFQASTQLGVYGEFEEFRNWFLDKILWNPSLDYISLASDFIHGYYGPAAEVIEAYFTVLQGLADLPDVHMHLYSGLEAGYLSKDFIMEWQNKLLDALSLVQDNEELTNHVEKVLLSLDYAYLIFPVEYKAVMGKIFPIDLVDRKKIYSRFKQYVKKFNIGVHGESVPIRAFIECQDMICQENSVLALAELAPTIVSHLNNLLQKVEKRLDSEGNFHPNDFINSAVISGFHPLELNHWMNLKNIGGWTPDADIWSRKFNSMDVNELMNPQISLVSKKQLPKVVVEMLKDLPNQEEKIDE
jgi:hypothetical protein